MLPGLMKYEIGGLASKAYFSEPIASFQQQLSGLKSRN